MPPARGACWMRVAGRWVVALTLCLLVGCAGPGQQEHTPPVAGSFVGQAEPSNQDAFVALVASVADEGEDEREVRVQPAEAPQIYCGPWRIESRGPTMEISNWQFWTYRWCYSPEVSGGYYKDYAGYSLWPQTALDVTLTYTPSADSVAVGEPVTFTITETNNEPYALTGMSVTVHPKPREITSPTEFVSATLSQGQCEFPRSQGGPRLFPNPVCYLGTLPPGATAVIDLIVVPQEPGIISTYVVDVMDPVSEGRCCGQGPQLTRYGASASVSVYSAGVP